MRAYPTSSANYRPLISSAVTATLFLHVNDSQMGPHILPPAHTMLSLKKTRDGGKTKTSESEGCHSSPQLASAQWQRARSLVREITTTPTPLLKSSPLHPSPLPGRLHHRLGLIWARSRGHAPRLCLSASFCVCQRSDERKKRNQGVVQRERGWR